MTQPSPVPFDRRLREQPVPPCQPAAPKVERDVDSLTTIAARAVLKDPETTISAFTKQYSFKEYSSLCDWFSSTVEQECRQAILQQHLDMEKVSFCILTTGSDGRNEKLSRAQSPVELVVYFPQKTDEQSEEGIIHSLDILIDVKKFFFPRIEKRNQDTSICITLDKIIPTRAIHSKILLGDVKFYKQYLQDFVREIKEMSPRQFKKFKTDFCKDSFRKLKQTLEGTQTDAVDLAKGTIQYDATFVKKSTKYCILRAVQYYLDKIICDFVRTTDEDTCLSFLNEMPSNTFQLIDFLHEKNLLDPLNQSDLDILKSAYELALMYFHITQFIYEAKQEPILLRLGENQRKDLCLAFENVARLLEKLNISPR